MALSKAFKAKLKLGETVKVWALTDIYNYERGPTVRLTTAWLSNGSVYSSSGLSEDRLFETRVAALKAVADRLEQHVAYTRDSDTLARRRCADDIRDLQKQLREGLASNRKRRDVLKKRFRAVRKQQRSAR